MTPKSSKKPPEDVEVNREILVQVVETVIPDFAKACLANIDVITIPQEQFAPDYNVDECTLLGMALKYAGVKGKEVRILRKQVSGQLKPASPHHLFMRDRGQAARWRGLGFVAPVAGHSTKPFCVPTLRQVAR